MRIDWRLSALARENPRLSVMLVEAALKASHLADAVYVYLDATSKPRVQLKVEHADYTMGESMPLEEFVGADVG